MHYQTSFRLQNLHSHLGCEKKCESADFETAISYAGYGKFQRILLVICGAIYATCAISTTTLSFVLPSAQCDFHLTSADKGKLSAMPLIGMIFGCSLWGSLADIHGRRISIILSLFVDFLAAFLSSFTYNFHLFLICRFFNGFGIIGATSIIFSYLGEFLSKKHQDTVLGRLEIFWTMGTIFLPGFAWALLNPAMMEKFSGHFEAWRIFVLVCSLPSLLCCITMYFLPETPKYLMAKGQFYQAKDVFQRIFVNNLNKSFCYYPVITLEGEIENNNTEKPKKLKLSHFLVKKFHDTVEAGKVLCSQPYLKYLLITGFADFGLMASYYTLVMWFPEIFKRFQQFELEYPDMPASVCIVSNMNETAVLDDDFCDATISDSVFLETIIIGLSCIPTSVSLSAVMKKFGKKTVLICCLVFSGLATSSLNWMPNSVSALVLSCIFEAFTSILEAVLFCVVVDLFPTKLRAICLAITATSGRLGAIFGSVIFGLLIDVNCAVPIYLFGFLLIVSGMLCIAIPQTDDYLVLH